MDRGSRARGLSTEELGAAVAELRALTGSAVIDVAVVRAGGSDDDLLLVLGPAPGSAEGAKKVFLQIATGGTRARAATTQRRFQPKHFVAGAASDVAKRELQGARVRSVAGVPGERLCTVHFATDRGDRRVVSELFGARGLWALLDAEGRVLALSREVASAGRTLAIGDRYSAPPAATGVTRDDSVRFAAPVLAAIDAHFTVQDLQSEVIAERDRIVLAARRALQKARDKERGIGTQLADAGRSARLRSDADMMLALARSVARGATSMQFEDPTTGEPREITLDPSKPVIPQAQALYEKARRLDDGRAVAERRHAEAVAEITALEAVLASIASVEPLDTANPEVFVRARAELQARGILRNPTAPATTRTRPREHERGENFRRFVSAEGYPILVGRDNEQNDRLTLRVANGNDVWLHVGGGRPGSHVVVRLPKQKTASLETLLDAAALAVHFSKARGEHRIEVVYTLKKHVRKPKGLPAGAVVPSQTKTIASLLDEVRLRRLLDSSSDADPA